MPPLDPATLFKMANTLVLPFWLLLAIAPRSSVTGFLVRNGAVSCVFAAFYCFCLAKGSAALSLESFASLEGLRAAFANDWVFLGGWLHYLAFDLFVGAYISSEHSAAGGSRILLLIKLFFTFMLGPVGLLIHKTFPLLLPQSRAR